nr:hypothetical protein GCM10020093_109370 [Planobispora longispora]
MSHGDQGRERPRQLRDLPGERRPLGPDALLYALADAGYDGVDSGPIGYLGTGGTLVERLARTGMVLAGGWIDLRYEDADEFAAGLGGLDAALTVFASVPVDDPRFAPRPTLACPDHPARFADGVAPGLPGEEWAASPAGSRRPPTAAGTAASNPSSTPTSARSWRPRGGRAAARPHRRLALPGHRPPLAGRGRPGDRGAAVARPDPAGPPQGRQPGDPRPDPGRGRRSGGGRRGRRVHPLGAGEVNLRAVLRELDGYEGWLVVEQDAPAYGQDLERVLDDQRANRAWLRAHGV